MITGRDESHDSYCMLHYDSRGVSRIYQLSLNGGVWQIWREAPGFSQRFTGTISGYWEKSHDGATWEHDFDLTYIRVG